MVASTITIENVYLDGRERNILAGGVSSLEDDTIAHESDSRTTITVERSERVRRNWQVSWSVASTFVTKLFQACRNSKGFIFISPIDEERVVTGTPLRNTATGTALGDGTTTTFQLQDYVTLSKDIGGGSITSELYDINYPLTDSVTAYADGIEVTVSGFSRTTGIVTLSAAPTLGAVMTADCERGFPVRWTSKSLSRTLLQVDQTEVRSGQFEEIF